MMDPFKRQEVLEWTDEALADGMSLGRYIRASGCVNTLDPEFIGGAPDRDLRLGSGAQLPWSILVERVRVDFSDGLLVVEMPLSLPSDPMPRRSRLATLCCGDEVYAVCPLSHPTLAIEETLRASDPSSMYVAAVLTPAPFPRAGCPTNWLQQGRSEVGAVLVGAQDGEAILYLINKHQ